MKLPSRHFLHPAARAAVLTAISLMVTLTGGDAWSQTTRTIKIVVPLGAGGSFDVQARLMADQISRAQGVTVVVENRPGGSTVIATEAAARAAPDGNTVLWMGESFVINSSLRKLNYDPLTSFEPICYLTRSSLGLVVNSLSPYRTLADLFEAARLKPGELTLATVGAASAPHLAFEMLKLAAHVDITHIPFPGAPPAAAAVISFSGCRARSRSVTVPV